VTLTARVGVRVGTLDLDVQLEVDDGEVVAVVGPNGAGKTTLLRAVAGLVALDRGTVAVDGRVLEDPAAGVRVAPEQRPVAVVFQDHVLFPHLSALENVAFGLRATGTGRAEARRRAQHWLEQVGMGDQAATRPKALSGGQSQRVALARALATQPRVLLLDEPLAAVDQAGKSELRGVLRRHLAASDNGSGDDAGHGGRLLVTHDPLDAVALADRLAVVEGGSLVQTGTAAEVTARPRSRWVAAMVGVNLVRGRAEAGRLTLGNGAILAVVGSGVAGDAFAVFHPRAVTVHRSHPEGSARNVLRGQAGELWREADRVRIQVDGDVPLVAEVTPAAVADLRLDEGGPVWVTVKATDVDLYPA
jgi:molybdate transport system ATP-binding protein